MRSSSFSDSILELAGQPAPVPNLRIAGPLGLGPRRTRTCISQNARGILSNPVPCTCSPHIRGEGPSSAQARTSSTDAHPRPPEFGSAPRRQELEGANATMADQVITCTDCGQEFVFTESEQAFYADRGFTTPRRCAACRAAKKAARGDSGGGSYSGGSSSYGSGGGYGGGGSRGPRRDVHRDLQLVRQRGIRPVPPVRRQAGLLLGLLQPALGPSVPHARPPRRSRSAAVSIPRPTHLRCPRGVLQLARKPACRPCGARQLPPRSRRRDTRRSAIT